MLRAWRKVAPGGGGGSSCRGEGRLGLGAQPPPATPLLGRKPGSAAPVVRAREVRVCEPGTDYRADALASWRCAPWGWHEVVPRPLGMLTQSLLARFQLVVTRFEATKIPKCLENGLFCHQKSVQNGSKTCFSKSDPRPFWSCSNKFFLAHFDPVVTHFGAWKIPKCHEMAHSKPKKPSKLAIFGPKMGQKVIPYHLVYTWV